MELTFSELRCKEVINLADGRRLGRVTDLVFEYPKNCVNGIVVPGGHKFSLFKSNPEIFIPMPCIVKIGEDVVIVDLKRGGHHERLPIKPGRPPKKSGYYGDSYYESMPAAVSLQGGDDYE